MSYNPVDLSYAAALIDGEGNIGVYGDRTPGNRFGRSYRLVIQIAMCDEEPIRFMYDTFGGSYHKYNSKSFNRKPRYSWILVANKAKDLLIELLPYFKGKVDQALVAIEFQTKRRKKHGGIIDPLSEEELNEQKSYSDKLKDLKVIKEC